jgi:phosphoglycerate-specific signal transduction histidine kinase
MNTEKILELRSQESQLTEYWNTLVEEERIQDNRHQRNVMFRHAFLVAASEHSSLGITPIARIIGRHHATLIHAKKFHESNLRFNNTYKSAYRRISSNLSDILMSDISMGDYQGYREENKALRQRLIELSRRNRELIIQNSDHIEQVEKKSLEAKLLRERIQEKDKRISFLNKKIASIAW